MCRESRYRITVSTFGGQPSPDITNRDGPQAAIVLAKCYHIPAKQNWSNLSGASTAEQQVHEVSQGLNQRTTCIPKSHQVQQMVRSKAVGPPADLDGNERIAPSTSAGVTCHAPATSGAGRPLSASGSGSTGCLSRKRPRLCSFGSAGCPPSQRIRTAALMLPSSSLAFTAASKAPRHFWTLSDCYPGQTQKRQSPSETCWQWICHPSNSTVRHLMVFVILWRLPARDGLAKMEGAKSKRVVHAPID